MSLEELRAMAEADEQVIDEPEVEEPEIEEDPEPETEEPEETDFELELEGEPEPDQQKKPSVEDALIHKLTKQKKRAQAAESEVETLKKELELLKQSISKPQSTQAHAGMPKFPDLHDDGIDGDREKYDQAVKDYLDAVNTFNNRHAEADKAKDDHAQRIAGMTRNLAVRTAKFVEEHKINVDRVASAIELAAADIDAVTGIDGAMAYLLDSVGDGSERVAYYIGTNEGARLKLKELLQEDRNGLKAIAHMTRLAEKLKPKTSREISKAPEPDKSIKGDTIATASAKKLQQLYDKESDISKLQKIRKRARELGIELKN